MQRLRHLAPRRLSLGIGVLNDGRSALTIDSFAAFHQDRNRQRTTFDFVKGSSILRFMVIVASLLVTAEATTQAGPLDRYQQHRAVASVIQPAPAQVRREASGTTTAKSDDALSEVNAKRTKRGLRPFLPDPLLNQAARTCARIRAANRIGGHLSSDFVHLPAGASAKAAGCGALEPSWGWGTCCTYDNYTYAGAAWVLGADGKRYMHLFVR